MATKKRAKSKTTKRRRSGPASNSQLIAKCRRKKTFHGAPVYDTLL